MTTIQTVATPLGTEAHADTRAVLLNQVSWGAIFAGAVTALVTQVVVNLVGVGIGLASVGTNGADNPAASTVSLGAGVWFVASGIVASLAGGPSQAASPASRCRVRPPCTAWCPGRSRPWWFFTC